MIATSTDEDWTMEWPTEVESSCTACSNKFLRACRPHRRPRQHRPGPMKTTTNRRFRDAVGPEFSWLSTTTCSTNTRQPKLWWHWQREREREKGEKWRTRNDDSATLPARCAASAGRTTTEVEQSRGRRISFEDWQETGFSNRPLSRADIFTLFSADGGRVNGSMSTWLAQIDLDRSSFHPTRSPAWKNGSRNMQIDLRGSKSTAAYWPCVAEAGQDGLLVTGRATNQRAPLVSGQPTAKRSAGGTDGQRTWWNLVQWRNRWMWKTSRQKKRDFPSVGNTKWGKPWQLFDSFIFLLFIRFSLLTRFPFSLRFPLFERFSPNLFL